MKKGNKKSLPST